jgi:ADP-ribosylation factor GTPase-activating protein 2/3
LSANPNGTTAAGRKSPSPLAAAESSDNTTPAPDVVRTTSATAVRKGPSAAGPRKANILGAKKGQKLGAKKVVGEEIDFEAAEKKAREEAERIEKLGYDPEAEKAEELAKTKSTVNEKTTMAAPTPISPPKAGFGSQQSHQRSPSEIERLGMGMGRLGFGQIGAAKSPAAPAPRKLGFGAVGASKAADGMMNTFRLLHLEANISRRLGKICTGEIWKPEGYLERRILWPQQLRPLSTS